MNFEDIYTKYADLLVNYCLSICSGEKVLVRATDLATPLLQPLYAKLLSKGAFVEFQISFENEEMLLYENGNTDQIKYISSLYKEAVESYDAILTILSSHNINALKGVESNSLKARQEAITDIKKIFMSRSAVGDLRWALCLFPTKSSAKASGMSLSEYQHFVFESCGLFSDSPKDNWLKLSDIQAQIVNDLNETDIIRYKNSKTDISFSTKNRVWINSDGKRNMPSGEVFTSPVEDSVNGVIYFDYPSYYQGSLLKGVTLTVENGYVISWEAEKGKDTLDRLFAIEGARYFGEAAIGTNYCIQKATKNILFDEKIGGTVHMAIGASYPETGGKNESSVHLDFIASMKHGVIEADGEVIYKNGSFVKKEFKKLSEIF